MPWNGWQWRTGKLVQTYIIRIPKWMAEYLDTVPNKNLFIKEAIETARGQAMCPTCQGSGKITQAAQPTPTDPQSQV